jgi:fructose-1,6-bisphosphatase
MSLFHTVIYAYFLVQIPKKGKIYSVNEGNAKNWDAPTAKYVDLVLFTDIAVS